jgi:peptidyl-dipeptidase A
MQPCIFRRFLIATGTALCGALCLIACSTSPSSAPGSAAGGASPSGPPTADEAKKFADQADADLLDLTNKVNRAQWVAANFITSDTEALSADALKGLIGRTMELAKQATRFDSLQLPEDTARRLKLLKLSATPLPAPSDPKLQTELTEITTSLEATYGRGQYCPPGRPCLSLNDLERIMAESRNPTELLDAWRGWHAIAPPMKEKYTRFVELGKRGRARPRLQGPRCALAIELRHVRG